jgi:hypothetical protein
MQFLAGLLTGIAVTLVVGCLVALWVASKIMAWIDET